MTINILIFTLFVVSLFTGDAQAGISAGWYRNASHPGKCYLNENVILSPGEIVRHPDHCSEFMCGENSMGRIHSCIPGRTGNCEYGDFIDENADFPLCCARRATCPGHPEDETKDYDFLKSQTESYGVGFVPRKWH